MSDLHANDCMQYSKIISFSSSKMSQTRHSHSSSHSSSNSHSISNSHSFHSLHSIRMQRSSQLRRNLLSSRNSSLAVSMQISAAILSIWVTAMTRSSSLQARKNQSSSSRSLRSVDERRMQLELIWTSISHSRFLTSICEQFFLIRISLLLTSVARISKKCS